MKNSLKIFVATIATTTTLLTATPAFAATGAVGASAATSTSGTSSDGKGNTGDVNTRASSNATVSGNGSVAIANSTTNNFFNITNYYAKISSSHSSHDCDPLILYKGYTGWVCRGSDWYYVNSDTTFKTGWFREDGYIYYFNTDGKMATGSCTIDGNAYYFNNVSDGHRGSLVPHKVSE